MCGVMPTYYMRSWRAEGRYLRLCRRNCKIFDFSGYRSCEVVKRLAFV